MSKVMVSLPDDLLELVDAEARKRSTSRSSLLAEALRRELTRRDIDAVNAAIARSQHRFRDTESFESADLTRSTRESAR
jgi:metal-responsive CopG/Arc/MetJ family transcriptional regulator